MMYVDKNLNLTQLAKKLNEMFKKKSGRPITCTDVQGYLRRGKLPSNMEGFSIEENREIKSVKLYNIVKNG